MMSDEKKDKKLITVEIEDLSLEEILYGDSDADDDDFEDHPEEKQPQTKRPPTRTINLEEETDTVRKPKPPRPTPIPKRTTNPSASVSTKAPEEISKLSASVQQLFFAVCSLYEVVDKVVNVVAKVAKDTSQKSQPHQGEGGPEETPPDGESSGKTSFFKEIEPYLPLISLGISVINTLILLVLFFLLLAGS